MPRSIHTDEQYEAEKRAYDAYHAAKQAGMVMTQAAPPEPPKKPDEYSDRLAKYVPAEVVTLYLALVAAVAQATKDEQSVKWLTENLSTHWYLMFSWAAFVVGLAATPTYLWFMLKVRSIAHLVICTLSFVVWAVAIRDGLFGGVPPFIPAFLLPIYTFGVAFYQPKSNA